LIRAVIFDMDGVIIDSEPMHYKILNDFGQLKGFNVSTDEYDTYIGTTDISMWGKLKEKHKLPETVGMLVNTHLNSCIDYVRTNKTVKPIKGIDNLIKSLIKCDIALAIASSAPKKRVDAVLETFGINKFFKAIVSGDEVKSGKPEPDVFLYSSKLLGIQPEMCVVIEDSYNGIKAAKAAGMKCIAYKNPNSGKQDLSLADMVINEFEKLNYDTIIAL